MIRPLRDVRVHFCWFHFALKNTNIQEFILIAIAHDR